MKIENDFEVPADPSETFGFLIDLERVGECIPGGEVGPVGDNGLYPVTVTVKLGPMRMNYSGQAQMKEHDDTSRRAVLTADVKEKRGQGTARATMTMTVGPAEAGSRVTTVTDVKLTGRAAQMGRGVVDDVAARLVTDMADCIAGRLGPADGSEADSGDASAGDGTAPPAAGLTKPIGGIRLMLQILWGRIKRLFKRLFQRRKEGNHD